MIYSTRSQPSQPVPACSLLLTMLLGRPTILLNCICTLQMIYTLKSFLFTETNPSCHGTFVPCAAESSYYIRKTGSHCLCFYFGLFNCSIYGKLIYLPGIWLIPSHIAGLARLSVDRLSPDWSSSSHWNDLVARKPSEVNLYEPR